MPLTVQATQASQTYAAAYAATYTIRRLPLALRLYQRVLEAHPADPEAEYARMQIQNIISAVVPRQELLVAQVELALSYLENGKPS